MRSGMGSAESSRFLELLFELRTFSQTVMSDRLVSMVSRSTLGVGGEVEAVISQILNTAVTVLQFWDEQTVVIVNSWNYQHFLAVENCLYLKIICPSPCPVKMFQVPSVLVRVKNILLLLVIVRSRGQLITPNTSEWPARCSFHWRWIILEL